MTSVLEMPLSRQAAALRLCDVAVTYPGADRSAPRSASLTVDPGETVLLVGPSACGKSSLSLTVNALAPRAVPARVSGDLRVHGTPVSQRAVAELSREVGMVFQDVDAQIVMETVFDEVAFGLENLCLPVPEIISRSERALRRMGLWTRRDDDPATLSGGQKQRLAIACALAMGTSLLVLDEPTANLDPAGVESVYAALREVVVDRTHAVLLIEHNLDAALPIVDRIVVLDQKGRTCLEGTAAEVLGARGAEVAALGVRLPAPTRIALGLRDRGVPFATLPTTIDELCDGLARHPDAVATVGHPAAAIESSQPVSDDGCLAAVELDRVTAQRGGRRVVDEASLRVEQGEFIGIVGVNGSGKTTLLQTIAGLIRPDSGRVRVLGSDPSPKRTRRHGRRQSGLVFQNPEHQFVADTVAEELAVSLAGADLTSPERQAVVERELERFGLVDARDRNPFLLSGGQKRRLSVATALVEGGQILLLDEPTFGQDQAYGDALVQLLGDVHRSGTTILMVSHDLDLIAEHTQRTVIVVDGGILSALPTSETFADDALLERAGLRQPAMAAALAACR